MSPERNSSEGDFSFEIVALMQDTSVVSFSAVESISFPFLISVLIATEDEIPSFDDLIGSESVLTIFGNDAGEGGNRYFHGVVRRFEFTGMAGDSFLYEAEVVPTFFFLSLGRNCRIFQDKTTEEIVSTVLEEAGISSNGYRLALANTGRTRGYCVQYHESDLDFISRLMEEEGIYYFFEHYQDRHVLVISDNLSVHASVKGETITCNAGGGLVAENECVSHFTFSQRQTPDGFTHRNFNFKKPALDLTANDAKNKAPRFEVYEYAAPHTSQAHGNALAKVRMEQLVALQKQGHGHSSSCRLTPGYKVALTGHGCQTLNAEYLIVEVSHAGSQSQSLEEFSSGGASYDNHFTVIPATTQFRPTVRFLKPVVRGVQTAIVVGPKGEEIHTDEYGRVKVQFHWDRFGNNDDRSSCWLRVAQAWGGRAWGAQFIPRVGDEVLVDFLEGDPDRPLVTGCLYNSDNLPIHDLEKSVTRSGLRTRSTPGGDPDNFHELRFDDKIGAEEIYLQSEKDWNILVKNDKSQTILRDGTLHVGNNRLKSVGVDQMEQVGRNYSETIGANKSVSIGANKSETVLVNSMESVGLAKELSIGGAYQVSVAGAMNETVLGAKAEEVGITKQVLVGSHMTERVTGNRSLEVGENLSANVTEATTVKARTIILEAADEIILKSGGATISLKSNGDISIHGVTCTQRASGEIVIKSARTSVN